MFLKELVLFKTQAQLGQAKLSHSTSVVAVTVGRDELEPSAVTRKVFSFIRADSLAPHGLEKKRSGSAEVGNALDVNGLDTVPALNFFVMVKFDFLQLQVNAQAVCTQHHWVQVWVLLNQFMKVVQVCQRV